MKNDLEKRTARFAGAVLTACERLSNTRTFLSLAPQLIRAASAVGAIYREAARAETRRDFIHKIGQVEKEAAESEYWLDLFLEHGASASDPEPLKSEANQLLRIMITSRRTAIRNTPKKPKK